MNVVFSLNIDLFSLNDYSKLEGFFSSADMATNHTIDRNLYKLIFICVFFFSTEIDRI